MKRYTRHAEVVTVKRKVYIPLITMDRKLIRADWLFKLVSPLDHSDSICKLLNVRARVRVKGEIPFLGAGIVPGAESL